MQNEKPSIHEFEINLICEYFSAVERQGPGSPEMTRRALDFTAGLHDDSRIADLGCGTGGQTMVLAQHVPGQVTGIDLFPRFIDLFNKQAEELGLQQRVKGITGSMDQLPFGEEELDLIWSEGSIYNIGFETGLRYWHSFLKKGAYVAVSEASWFTPERPEEIEQFWQEGYPGIDTIPHKVAQMESAGFIPVASFILPEQCWSTEFFAPQVKAREIFLAKYAGNPAAENFIAYMLHEEELYRKYKEYYGYVFYIGKKR